MSFTAEYLLGDFSLTKRAFELAGADLSNAKRAGDEWIIFCFFHDDGPPPNLNVNLKKATFLCRRCGTGGDVVDFYARRKGLSVEESIAQLRLELNLNGARRDSRPLAEPQAALDAEAYWTRLAEENPEGVEYLKGRGLWPLPEGLVRFDAADPPYCVAVRLLDAVGRIVGIERRAVVAEVEPKMKCVRGSKKKGSAFGHLNESPRVWIVEGLADYLAASSMMHTTDVCVLGVPGVGFAADLVENRAAQFLGKVVFLSLDSDPAGERGRDEAARALQKTGAKRTLVAPYPAGFHDLAELVEQVGSDRAAEVMFEILESAAALEEMPAGGDAENEVVSDRDPERVPKGWRRPAEVLDAIPQPKCRFATTFPALNAATRGGIPTGIVIVIVGWPDAGKTGLGTQIAVQIALENVVVVVLFTPDGGQEATAIRIGGLLGLDQDKLEARDIEEKNKLTERVRDHRIFIVDDAQDGMVFERIRTDAEKFRPDLPHIYLVDSAQECLANEKSDELDERHRAIALMRAVYRTVEANPIPSLAIVTSQAAGQAFTPPKRSERTPPIGAPAESKKISYLCHMIIALEGDPSRGPDFGRAAVVKSKLRGPKPSFGLLVDPATSRLKEIDPVVVEEAQQERKARTRDARVAKIADWIETLLIKAGPLLVEEIRSRITGDKGDISDALESLEAQGRAAWEPAGRTNRGRRWNATKGPKASDP